VPAVTLREARWLDLPLAPTPEIRRPAPVVVQPPPRSLPRRLAGKATRPLRRWMWNRAQLLRYGRPTTLLTYGEGYGDHLLCTSVFHELRRRGHKGLWMMSNHPDLFRGNADVDVVVPMNWRYPELAVQCGGRSVFPDYAHIIEAEDRSVAPVRHVVTCMCSHLGITGEIALRPYLSLTPGERNAGRVAARQIAIQSSILSASLPIRNKEWVVERFQAVVDALGYDYTFVQVGAATDPKLEGVVDLRGKATVRQTAAVMSQSLVFVGLVGFLMHLARSVDCRSVIVYGGREAPWQSGYSCNENLYTPLPCAPCWQWNTCQFGRRCMTAIEPQPVIAAVESQVEKLGLPLPVDTDVL
jgi:hypothetical protein